MKIREKILAKLEKNYSDLHKSSIPHPLEIEEQSLKIRIELLDFDRLGCALHQITLQDEKAGFLGPTTGSSPDNTHRLDHLAHKIAEKITYLLEDMSLIEWDKKSSTLIMRSQPPESNSRYICYYELLLSQGSCIALARYRFDREKKSRSHEPINLTREVFFRLIDDLATILTTCGN